MSIELVLGFCNMSKVQPTLLKQRLRDLVLFCVVLLFSLSICLLPDEHPKIDGMVNKTVRDIAAIFLLIIIALPFCVYFTLYTVK